MKILPGNDLNKGIINMGKAHTLLIEKKSFWFITSLPDWISLHQLVKLKSNSRWKKSSAGPEREPMTSSTSSQMSARKQQTQPNIIDYCLLNGLINMLKAFKQCLGSQLTFCWFVRKELYINLVKTKKRFT